MSRRLTVLAGLVAAGLLSEAEARTALHAAPPATQPANRDSLGAQARAAWALADTEAAWRAARRRAVWRVRDALAPLLARRACRATLWEAAERADAGAVLLPAERRRLLEAEVARALRMRR